jgi:hypothetical protein
MFWVQGIFTDARWSMRNRCLIGPTVKFWNNFDPLGDKGVTGVRLNHSIESFVSMALSRDVWMVWITHQVHCI